MPTQGQYAQFLAPQRAGEQVPDSQIVTQGPFTDELSKPAFVAPKVHETGFGGPGHAMLAFANNFLAGAAQGRLRQFQASEQAKKEHERNYDATVQHILDSPKYTTEFKEATLQQALQDKAGAGHAALGGGKGGKNDHPLTGLARSIFTGVVGPAENKKHVDLGPEHVSSLITRMHDPANQFNLADAVSQAQGKVNDIIQQRQGTAAKIDAGQDITSNATHEANAATARMMGLPAPAAPATPAQVAYYREHAMADKDIQEALQPLSRQGYDPFRFSGISNAFGALPARPTQAQILAQKTQEARTKMYEERGRSEALKRNAPGAPTLYEDTQGQRFGAVINPQDGFAYFPGTKNRVPEERMVGARPIPQNVQAAEIRGENDAQKMETAQYIITHPNNFPEDQYAAAIKYSKEHAPQPAGTKGRGFTPLQTQNQKIKKFVGELRMKHGDNLPAALEDAKTILGDDPAAFADVEKALKAAAPKTKNKPALSDAAKELFGIPKDGKPTAAPPANGTTPPPVTNAAPAAPINPQTKKPFQVGETVMYQGKPAKFMGVFPDGALDLEQ